MKKLTLLIIFLVAATGTPALAELSDTGVLLDRIVAVVNEGVVLQSELDRQTQAITQSLGAQGVALPPPDVLRAQVLESLVMKRIQLQRAERLGLVVSDEELNRSLSQLAERNNLTLGDLPAALASQGIDYTRYREDLREEMALEQLRGRDVASRISITRAEVEKMVARSAPDNLEYEVMHLLIATDSEASEDEVATALQEAEELYERIETGEKFGALAIAYSDAPGVLVNRGSLGYLKANELPSIFADTITRMSPGETAPPIRSPSGFHIVQLRDIRGIDKVVSAERLARHILITPNEVLSEEEARQKLLDIKTRVEAGEDFATFAEAESEDPSSAARGGDLDWAPRGTFVPEFEDQLDNLQKGELSEPFRSGFGWHIVQLLDTRERDSTIDMRFNQAAQALRARKFEEEAQDWMRQLRDEAYVEISLDGSG